MTSFLKLTALALAMTLFTVGCGEKTESSAAPEANGDTQNVSAGDKTPCPADCTKACCADKADGDKAPCPADCTKPCCADKSSNTDKAPCPTDCTKACCTAKK